MARVLPGSTVADIRGAVGGSVFQRSAHGLSLRSKTTPVNPSTASQNTNRAQLFALQNAWTSLTDSQRTSWEAWAQFQNLQVGQFQTSQMSGQQAFIQLNRYRLLWSLAILEDPIFTPYTLPQSQLEIEDIAGTVYARFTDQAAAANYRPVMLLSWPLKASRNAKPPGTKLIIPDSNFSATEWIINNAYTTAFGITPAADMRLWYSWFLMQLSNSTLSIVSTGTITIA